MKYISREAILNALKHIKPEEEFQCSFLFNFKAPDLIFGLGDIIPQYFGLLKITRTLQARDSAGEHQGVMNELFEEVCGDDSAFIRLLTAFLLSYEENHENLQAVNFRSNFFINLYGLRTRVDNSNNEFSAIAEFDEEIARKMTPTQVHFAADFFESAWSLSNSTVQGLAKGIRKDTSKPQAGNSDYQFVKANLGSVRQFMVRRACKYLLYDVANRGGTIHYALDEIDLTKVANIDGAASTVHLQRKDVNKRPVCTSELRELFRMWNYFKESFRVRFYSELQTSPAPWHMPDHRIGWAAYVRRLATKELGKLAPEQQRLTRLFTEIIDEQNPEQAITKYHNIPYSQLARKGARVIEGFGD